MKHLPSLLIISLVWATSAHSQGCLDPYLNSTAFTLSFTETAKTKPTFQRVDGRKFDRLPSDRSGNGMTNAIENQVSEELRDARGKHGSPAKHVQITPSSSEEVTVTFTLTPTVVSGNPNHLKLDISKIEVANDDNLPEGEARALEEKIDRLREHVEATNLDLTKVASGKGNAQTRLNSQGAAHIDASALLAGLKSPLTLRGPSSVTLVQPAKAYSGRAKDNNVVKGHPSSLYDYLRDLETKLDHRDQLVERAARKTAELGEKVKSCQPVKDLYGTLFRGAYDTLKQELDAAEAAIAAQRGMAGSQQALASARDQLTLARDDQARLTAEYKAKTRYVADHASDQPAYGDQRLTGKRPMALDAAIRNLQDRKLRVETAQSNSRNATARAAKSMTQAIAGYERKIKALLSEKNRHEKAVLGPLSLRIQEAIQKSDAARDAIAHLTKETAKAEVLNAEAIDKLRRMRPALPAGAESAAIRRATEEMLHAPSRRSIKNVVGAFEEAAGTVGKAYKACATEVGDRLAEVGRLNHEVASLQKNVDGLKRSAACLVRKRIEKDLAAQKSGTADQILKLQKELSDALKTTSAKGYSEEQVKQRVGLSEDTPLKHRPADAFDAIEEGLKFMGGAEKGGIIGDVGWGKFGEKFSQQKGTIGKVKKYSDAAVSMVDFYKAMSTNDPQFLSKGLKFIGGFSNYVGPHTALAAEAIIGKGVRLNDAIRERDAKLFLEDPSKKLYSRRDIENARSGGGSAFDKAKREARVNEYQILRFQALYAR